MTEPEKSNGQGRAPVLSEEPLENSSGAVAEATDVAKPVESDGAAPAPATACRRPGTCLRPRHRQALLRLGL